MQHRSQQCSRSSSSRSNQTGFAGRFVFPYDAEDIKAHKWFKGVPWDRLHELDPPFVPLIRGPDDTQYFDEDEPVMDFSDTDEDEEGDHQPLPELDTSTPMLHLNTTVGRDGADDKMAAAPPASATKCLPRLTVNHIQQPTPAASEPGNPAQDGVLASTTPRVAAAATATLAVVSKKRVQREAQLAEALGPFHRSIQNAVRSWLAFPYDSLRLRNFELQVDAEPGLRTSERDALKALVRVHGRKEQKRPRDRLLRDPSTKKAVLEERKKTAFMGYDWTRVPALPITTMDMLRPVNDLHCGGCAMPPGFSGSFTTGNVIGGVVGSSPKGSEWPCSSLLPGDEDLAAMRALQRGRLSMN